MKNPVLLAFDGAKTNTFILRGLWKVKAKAAGWTPEEIAAFDKTLNGLSLIETIARMRPFAVNNGNALPIQEEPANAPSVWGFDADDGSDDDDDFDDFDDEDDDDDEPKAKAKKSGGSGSSFDFDNWFAGDDE